MKNRFKKASQSNHLSTELHQATRAGDQTRVRLLIARGADINSQDNAGTTPLMLAAHYGHHGILCDLIQAGCDIDIQNNEGECALYAARRMSLFTNREHILNTLEFALMHKDDKQLRHYIEQGMPTQRPVKRPRKAQFKPRPPAAA